MDSNAVHGWNVSRLTDSGSLDRARRRPLSSRWKVNLTLLSIHEENVRDIWIQHPEGKSILRSHDDKFLHLVSGIWSTLEIQDPSAEAVGIEIIVFNRHVVPD